MVAGLETFAKVRALHDRATIPGEKAAAASRMEALARTAGMTVDEALSKLDAPKVKPQAQAAADDLNEFFNSPFFRQQRAAQERKRAEKWRLVLAEYGSEEAVFAPGPWECALKQACQGFVVRKATTGWPMGSLWGWNGTSLKDPAPPIVEAIATAHPMPRTVREAWAEFQFWDKLGRDREAFGSGAGDPEIWVQFRTTLIERHLDTLPAGALHDLRARLDWMDWRNSLNMAPDPKDEAVRLTTLRADIERMGERIRERDEGVVSTTPTVQSGHGEGGVSNTHPPLASDLRAEPSPVQSGHPRRTNADKRRGVRELLGNSGELTDREIARRAGVSPTTVGTIRRSLA